MTVGDINSSEVGSGARFNGGKPPFDLVPISMIAAFYGVESSEATAMAALGRFQEGGDADELMNAMADLGQDGWAECALVFDYGRGKYAAWNWAKGMDWSVPLACAVRHLLSMMRGETLDTESGLPHRGHVFCNLVMLWTYHRTFKQGDDRPAPHLLKAKQ